MRRIAGEYLEHNEVTRWLTGKPSPTVQRTNGRHSRPKPGRPYWFAQRPTRFATTTKGSPDAIAPATQRYEVEHEPDHQQDDPDGQQHAQALEQQPKMMRITPRAIMICLLPDIRGTLIAPP